jgi:hypothetical protein
MKMETTHVSETSTLYIHTPENYPKKIIFNPKHVEEILDALFTLPDESYSETEGAGGAVDERFK